MLNIFYHELAPYYDLISRDRDVESQCQFLASQLERRPEEIDVLELFAGPPHHASFFKKNGGQVLCIDSSKAMQQIALEQYGVSEEEYWVGLLPEVLEEREVSRQFDLVLALRYSIGLISRIPMECLLRAVRKKMVLGGVFAIELHRIDLLMEQFSSLSIRERTTFDETGAQIVCQWPSGPMKWNPGRFQVEMPIRIEVTQNGIRKEYSTSSQETIYTLEDLEKWVQENSLYEILPSSYAQAEEFPQSNLVLLRSI